MVRLMEEFYKIGRQFISVDQYWGVEDGDWLTMIAMRGIRGGAVVEIWKIIIITVAILNQMGLGGSVCVLCHARPLCY